MDLAWAGNPEHPNDARRSCGFAPLRPLVEDRRLRELGIESPNLEKGEAPQGLMYSPKANRSAGVARVITGLDLVIAVDSCLDHLAGAMGCKVWLLLAEVCDWRWGLEGDTTGWYLSMRLYHQAKGGEWAAVVKILKQHLSNEFTKNFRAATDE